MCKRILWQLIIIASLTIGAANCAGDKSTPDSPGFASIVKFFDVKTRKAFGNYRQEITKHRKPTTLHEQGESYRIKTCAELLELLEQGLSLEEARVDRVFSGYQTCLVLSILRYAQSPRVSYFKHQALGDQILKHLNLATLRSSLYPRAKSPKQGFTFSDFKFSSIETTPHALAVEDEGWRYGVNVLAASDFNGDGIEDVVATFYDDAKTGTYFSITTLLLTQTEPDGRIAAEDAGGLVRGSGDY
ncbi:MAG: hypothetical protein OES46_10525 [Gammaproteobacteria bacterium]|nr:hypothetical protein [Gammaproteobacteria bacterium]